MKYGKGFPAQNRASASLFASDSLIGGFLTFASQTLQTVLHYCYSYGFTELGEYFISKGADDSVRNADGLTCYEGLDIEDVNAI